MKRKLAALLCALVLLTACAGFPGAAARAEAQELMFGTLGFSSAIRNAPAGDSFYFSDEWFAADPEEPDVRLALISAQLSAASDGTDDAALLRKLGFADVESVRFDSEESLDCAYVTGTKTLPGESGARTVRAVVFQGRDYGEKGWIQNMTVNPEEGISEEHAAYAAAAEIFLEDYDRMPQAENTLLWLCGLSRGGAVANVVSAYLLARENAPELVCFTFESPATTQREGAHDDPYRCIHNYLSDDDPVPMIPMWGMTRFGTDIRLNTESAAELQAVLDRTDSAAAEYMASGNRDALGGDVRAFLTRLIDKLILIVPEREDYSAVRTIPLPENPGTYTIQGGLTAVCRLLFGSGLSSISGLSDVIDCLPDIVWATLAEARAAEDGTENREELLQQAAQVRWDAAGFVLDLLPEDIRQKIRREDVYALLQLIAPQITDFSLMTEGWELLEKEELWDAKWVNISSIIAAAGNSSLLILSHHPEIVVARMKMLAPAPEFPAYDLSIPAPAAGDPAEAAPDSIAAQAGDAPDAWLRAEETGWLSDAETLADGQVHYLAVTLASVGHLVPDSFRFTLNGAEPAEQEIRQEDGITRIRGLWPFRLGEPAPAAVRFDMAGHGEAPEPYTVESGTLLRLAETKPADPGIVRDEAGTWKFTGWTGDHGEAWEEAAAVQDITLHASWLRLIDNIELTYRVPRRGESGEEALHSLTLPEGLPLRLDGISVSNDSWETIEEIGSDETCLLNIILSVDAENCRFLTETAEDGEEVYAGTMTVNGDPAERVFISEYTDDEGIDHLDIQCEYTFRPEEP